MMAGTLSITGTPYPGQEQSMNIRDTSETLDYLHADLLGYFKHKKLLVQSMTRAGLRFLMEHQSVTLVCLTPDVWALEPVEPSEEALDALLEQFDEASGERGLMFRMAT